MIHKTPCQLLGLAVIVISLVLTGCAGTKQFVLKAEPAPGTSRIYLVKTERNVGAWVSLHVYDGPVKVGTLGPKGYLEWCRPAGHMDLYAGYRGGPCVSSAISMDINPDSTYYLGFTTNFKYGGNLDGGGSRPHLGRLQEGEARVIMDELKSAEIAPTARTYAEAATDKSIGSWPGPATADQRWAEAWPGVRNGMGETELNDLGIYLQDMCIPCATMEVNFWSSPKQNHMSAVYGLGRRTGIAASVSNPWLRLVNGVLSSFGTGVPPPAGR
jgi:hypothetical protein